jgi:hypothetical protein
LDDILLLLLLLLPVLLRVFLNLGRRVELLSGGRVRGCEPVIAAVGR